MYDLVSLGEVMLRLSPPHYERFRQASTLDIHVCGAQFNVAADLALLGKKTAFLSKLPDNELGLRARDMCMQYGVDMSYVKFVPNTRVGVIYVEFAVEPRASLHIYDRQGSAASTMTVNDFTEDILRETRLAYVDGIFPALNSGCRETTLAFVQAAKRQGCKLCFDINYRESLWKLEEARGVYQQILRHVDILVTSRSVSELLFDYRGSDEDLMHRWHDDFGCGIVCLTSRESFGALRGGWKSMALHMDKAIYGRPFEFEIVDRFGTGDAFFAGFLYGYLERDVQFALDFGNAACAIAHTIQGDVAHVSVETVMKCLAEGYSATVRR